MITQKEVSFLFQCDCPNCKEYNPVIFRAFVKVSLVATAKQ